MIAEINCSRLEDLRGIEVELTMGEMARAAEKYWVRNAMRGLVR
jgi:hypothetical protein